jgi:Tol biopolymer transport system component
MMSRRRTTTITAVAVVAVLALAGCNKVSRVTTSTEQGGGACLRSSLSADGKWLAFSTFRGESGETRPQKTLLKGLADGHTRLLAGNPSLASPTQSLSANGSLAVFSISSGIQGRIYLWTRATGARTPISPAAEDNQQAVISADGKKVAYGSGDVSKMWLYDVAAKTRTEIPGPPGLDAGSPFSDIALSSTGRYIVYRSFPDNGFYVRDLVGGAVWSLMSSIETSSGTLTPSISADGRYVAYAKTHEGLLGRSNQVYVWDRTTGTSTRITGVAPPKLVGQPTISGDGSRVAYTVNVVDGAGQLVVVDRATRKVVTTVKGNSYIESPVLSADGHLAAFCSPATDLAPNSPAAPNLYTWSDR